MLLHIPGVLSTEQAREMGRRLAASEAWVDGRHSVGSQGAEVKRNQQLDEDCELCNELGNRVHQALLEHPLFFAAALPRQILAPRFNRYRGGETYGMHVDGSVMRKRDGEQMRSDLSCTLFFSEPEDYDGGELVVSDTYGEHDVKLPAGDLILYPSSSLHSVNPVTRGERLASICWVQSMVRNLEQRRMLLEMDTAITRLQETGADRQPLVELTGIYHNLLRQWAEV